MNLAASMNIVTMICYNTTPEQLALAKDTVASVLAQDISVKLLVWDNGSTEPDTRLWLQELTRQDPRVSLLAASDNNVSPVAVGNLILRYVFERFEAPYLLGVPNDVVLPPNFYRECLRWPRGWVTASQTAERNFPHVQQSQAVSDHTPAAVGLIRRWFYDALVAKDGYFSDERYKVYANDCDLALRMAACGIRGVQLDMQYWHSGSASWRLAVPDISRAITTQADVDRQAFVDKWGFSVSDPAYGKRCGDTNFRGEGRG